MKCLGIIFLALSFSLFAEDEASPTIDRALEFAKGHETFRNVSFKLHETEYLRLVKEGQSPKTLIISCSDSRVIPELISSSNPGDLFVIRTAGNFIPKNEGDKTDDGVSATIQYAIEVLNITDIIVCGHSNCGAIDGLFSTDPKLAKMEILGRWLRWGEEAKKFTTLTVKSTASPEKRNRIAERLSVIYQLEHLLTFPFVKQRVDEGKIFLHGWHFDIASGQVAYYNPATYQFVPLEVTRAVSVGE